MLESPPALLFFPYNIGFRFPPGWGSRVPACSPRPSPSAPGPRAPTTSSAVPPCSGSGGEGRQGQAGVGRGRQGWAGAGRGRTHWPREVCTSSVMRVEVAGQTQFSASMAYLHSSSQTT